MDVYKKILGPLLFRLDCETAHNLAKAMLRRPRLARIISGDGLSVADKRLSVRLGSLELANPVGIGPGFDKDCDMVAALRRLGFGYIVVGSIMVRPRPGNPRPRMVRDIAGEGLWSCMGLPSRGIDYAAGRLARLSPSAVPLVISFNAEEYGEYLRCAEVLGPRADALGVSLFCPNTAAEGEYLKPDAARHLIDDIAERTEKPIFVKMPGYLDEDEREARHALIKAVISCRVDAITATPKTLVKQRLLSICQGTYTGRPAFQKMLRIVSDVYNVTEDRCPIKAVGGIFSSGDAARAIGASATSCEVVTGLGFEGWRIAANINRGFVRLMDEKGIADLTTLRGKGRVPFHE